MASLKQELERAEERIECVEYRSAERAGEIEDSLDTYVTRVRILMSLLALECLFFSYLLIYSFICPCLIRLQLLLPCCLSLDTSGAGLIALSFSIKF